VWGWSLNNTKVIELPASAHYTVEQAIDSLEHRRGELTDILMVGYDSDNDLFVRSSHLSRAEALFLLEKAKEWVMYGGLNG
jgi:hypothetical protein